MFEEKNKKDTHPLTENTPGEAASLLINHALKGVDLSSLAHVSEVAILTADKMRYDMI